MINNKMVIDQLINRKKGRSTWARAVNDYTIEIVEAVDDVDWSTLTNREIESTLLNGNDDWQQYSYSGCALISNYDIIVRLWQSCQLVISIINQIKRS